MMVDCCWMKLEELIEEDLLLRIIIEKDWLDMVMEEGDYRRMKQKKTRLD